MARFAVRITLTDLDNKDTVWEGDALNDEEFDEDERRDVFAVLRSITRIEEPIGLSDTAGFVKMLIEVK